MTSLMKKMKVVNKNNWHGTKDWSVPFPQHGYVQYTVDHANVRRCNTLGAATAARADCTLMRMLC